jgi:hypothetical protein
MFSPEHRCILTMDFGRFLQSRTQAVMDRGSFSTFNRLVLVIDWR